MSVEEDDLRSNSTVHCETEVSDVESSNENIISESVVDEIKEFDEKLCIKTRQNIDSNEIRKILMQKEKDKRRNAKWQSINNSRNTAKWRSKKNHPSLAIDSF